MEEYEVRRIISANENDTELATSIMIKSMKQELLLNLANAIEFDKVILVRLTKKTKRDPRTNITELILKLEYSLKG